MPVTWRVADTPHNAKTVFDRKEPATAMATPFHPHTPDVPAAWEKVITAYVRHQNAEGHFSPNTVKADLDALNHLARHIGVSDPWAVTYLDLVEFFAQYTWAPNTKKARRRAFVNFYDWAIDIEIFTAANPARRLKIPKVPDGVSTPTPADVFDLALQLETRRDIRLMIRIAGETGLRRGEYATCRREDLVLRPDGWELHVPRGKGNKARFVMVSPYLAGLIQEHTREGFLFPSKRGPHMSPAWAGTLVARALRRAGGNGSGHGLRHKAANDLMRQTGNDIVAVKYQLGHENIKTTEGYIIPDTGKLRSVMNARTAA